jgi:hypothetical protein
MFHYLIVKDQKSILSTSITFIHTINLHLNRKKSRNQRNLFFAKNDFYLSSFSHKLPNGMIQNYQLKPSAESLEITDIFHYHKSA